MNAKEKIQQEKLANILDPEAANKRFKITIRFQQNDSEKYQKAFEIAQKNKYFLEEGEENSKKIYVSFYPEDAKELHTMFNLVEGWRSTKIYLNNKLIPYVQDLWLFLMWFYTVK